MKDFTLETAKIAGLQSELCVVKEENKCLVRKVEQLESEVVVVREESKDLVRKVEQLESEVVVVREESKDLVRKVEQLDSEVVELKSENCEFKSQMTDLKSENGILKNLNKAIIERLSKVEKAMLSSQSSSVFAGQSDESVVGSVNVSDCLPSHSIAAQVNVSDEAEPSSSGSGGETGAKGSATIVKKPKAQRKREQKQLYKNFSKTMAGKKVQEKLWASGYLKMCVDQWEGGAGCMQPNELCHFVEKNIGRLVSFASSAESKERLILTLLKICGDRAVPKENLKEILDCFVRRETITEDDVVKFLGMYKI